MQKRMSFDEYFMSMANLAKLRSTCIRRQVGAVAVREGRVLATGYNGAPSGMEHCDKESCIRTKLSIPSGEMLDKCYALHAEANTILQSAIHGVSMAGCTLYCTCSPCINCMKLLIGVKAKRIVWEAQYPDEFSIHTLERAGYIKDTESIYHSYIKP